MGEKTNTGYQERYTHAEDQLIPLEHRISLEKVRRIAAMVGNQLPISLVGSSEEIPESPGLYVVDHEADPEDYLGLTSTSFELEAKVLSGKANSAHTVLPGKLWLTHQDGTTDFLRIAAKLYRKRTFDENFPRAKTEIIANTMQEALGELAFHPLALAIAPKQADGDTSDPYDILLVTRLQHPVQTFDAQPWHRGFTERNNRNAKAAVKALGRFNTHIGEHGDAKVKNVCQKPPAKTSMIDFETSHIFGPNLTPQQAMDIAHTDLSTFFESLKDVGYFDVKIDEAGVVIDWLAQNYLDEWAEFPTEVHESVLVTVTNTVDHLKEVLTHSRFKITHKHPTYYNR